MQRKQLAFREGIDMMRQARKELAANRSLAGAWGVTAIVANAIIIPLNIIVNAFDMKAATTLYQYVVRAAYDEFAKSGTRVEGKTKVALGLLKRGVIDAMKKRGMTEFVPGVSIIVGLAEDSVALFQVTSKVDRGNREMAGLTMQVDQKIAAMERELSKLAIREAEILRLAAIKGRTA